MPERRVFTNLAEAQAVIERRRMDYNTMRPYSAHGGLTPDVARGWPAGGRLRSPGRLCRPPATNPIQNTLRPNRTLTIRERPKRSRPTVVALLGDPDIPRSLRDAETLSDQNLRLAQLTGSVQGIRALTGKEAKILTLSGNGSGQS